MNPTISEIIPNFSHKKNKEVCKDSIYIGIDFGTSTTVVSCCYWDDKTDNLKIEKLNLDEIRTNPPMKTHLVPTVVYIDKDNSEFIIGQSAKLKRIWPNTLDKANYFSSFKMELGQDLGSSYNQSILLDDREFAKQTIASIGAELSLEEGVDLFDDFYNDLIKKLIALCVGEIPKKDIIDSETKDVLLPKGKAISRFKAKSRARRFRYWEFGSKTNLPKLQTLIKKSIKVYKKLEKNNINGEDFLIDQPWKAAATFIKSLKDKIEQECGNQFPEKKIYYTASIPASFGSNQRQDLLKALKSAGIEIDIKLLIDEPNAAFLSWLALDEESKGTLFHKSHILVFDFGAGTCDTSLLEATIDSGDLKIKNLSLSRFSALGGDDLDRKIAESIVFNQICEENNLNKMDISSSDYIKYFELPLMAVAENLKIAASKKLKANPKLSNSDTQISINESISINYKEKMITLEAPIFSYEEFGECVQSFFEEAEEESEPKSFYDRARSLLFKPDKVTIFDLIEDTLSKAKLDKDDIDYLLFIGGSSNLPQISENLENYFTDETESLYPEDMQSHVSKGVALHSFLSHGLNSNPITEILAETIFLQLEEGQTAILNAGTRIPESKDVLGFRPSNRNLTSIEMPFYSGPEDDPSARRVIQKVTFELPEDFDYGKEIYLRLIVDPNKVVELEGYYDDILLVKDSLNPLANVALDEYSTKSAKLQKEINNIQAKSKDSYVLNWKVKELIYLHRDHGNHLACLNLYEEFFDDEYTNINFHAGHAGEDELSKKYSKLAYENDPSGVSAYNLAIEYPTDSKEYRKYMEESATEYSYISAKFRLGEIIIKEDSERAKKLINEAYKSLTERFKDNPNGLPEWKYIQLKAILQFHIEKEIEVDKNRDLLKKVRQTEDDNLEALKGQKMFYNKDGLLTKKDIDDGSDDFDHLASELIKKTKLKE